MNAEFNKLMTLVFMAKTSTEGSLYETCVYSQSYQSLHCSRVYSRQVVGGPPPPKFLKIHP